MKNNLIRLIISLLFFLILAFGGFGNLYIIEIAGLAVSGILFLTQFYSKKDYKFPKQTNIFLIFIACQLVSLIWSNNIFNSIEYIVLFISSFGFWIFFYNSDNFYKKYLIKIIPILGILFFLSFFFTSVIELPFLKKFIPENTCTLYSPYTMEHNHLGDFWAIISLIYIVGFLTKQRFMYILGISFGLFVLVFSQSRSALMGILVSLYLFLINKNFSKETKKYFKLIVLFLILIFLIISAGKVTFFSRPYYIQAIISLFKNPLGVGMGNFKYISSNITTFNFATSSAAKAHNIFFEVTSGLGILSISFIVFFVSAFREALKKKNYNLPLLIFILITVNFSFDVTYAIPTMLWLWFSTLGIALSESVKS